MSTKHIYTNETDTDPGGRTMTGLSQLAKRRPLTTFFVLAYGLSWALWIPLCVLRDATPRAYVALALPIGSTVPSAVAILLTAASLGKGGVRALLRRLLIWRVGLRWYLVLLVATAIVLVAITAAAVLIGGPTATLAVPIANAVILVVLMTFPGSALGEEIGWRGYALPRLQTRRSALTSSLILGVLHFVWHLPLWLRGLTDYPPLSLYPAFAIQVVAFAVIYTWLYNNTNGSLLLAVLFHTATNAPLTLILLPLGLADFVLPFWLMALLTVLAAIIVVAVAGPSQLSRKTRQQETSGISRDSSIHKRSPAHHSRSSFRRTAVNPNMLTTRLVGPADDLDSNLPGPHGTGPKRKPVCGFVAGSRLRTPICRQSSVAGCGLGRRGRSSPPSKNSAPLLRPPPSCTTRQASHTGLWVVTAGEQPTDWLRMQDELAALSSDGVHRIVAGATHGSLLFAERDAAVSVAAIDQVVQAVRKPALEPVAAAALTSPGPADEAFEPPKGRRVPIYDIRVAGDLDPSWSEWFDGLRITNLECGVAVLSGDLVDQAALHGTLNKIRDLNLSLISVTSMHEGR